MKFISIQKARGLEFGKEVFLKDETTSKYYIGKLVKEETTSEGTIRAFSVAAFDPLAAGEMRTDFTHVAIPN